MLEEQLVAEPAPEEEKQPELKSIEELPEEDRPPDSPPIEKYIIIAKDATVQPDGIGFQVQGMDMDEAIILLMHGSAKFEKEYEKWIRDKY